MGMLLKGGSSSKSESGPIDLMSAVKSFRLGAQDYQRVIAPYVKINLDELANVKNSLSPYQDTAYDATNELRQMLGLAPLSKTAHLADEIRTLSDSLKGQPGGDLRASNGASQMLESIASLYDKAENAQDPQERSKFFQQAVDQSRAWVSNTGPALGSSSSARSQAGRIRFDKNTNQNMGLYDSIEQRALDDSRRIVGDQMSSALQRMSDITDRLESNFSQAPLKPTSPQEIARKVRDLPDYQFRFDQGQQAVQRSQAAKGMLASGNALTELTQFGQGLASQAYGEHVNRLAGLIQSNQPQAQAQTAAASQYAQAVGQVGQQLAGNQQQMGNLIGQANLSQISRGESQSSGQGGGLLGSIAGPLMSGLFGGLF